jgi:hypothetical protein
MSEIDHSEYYADTIDEFAVKNRISRAQVYKEIAADRLAASKIGTRTIITKEAGAAWRRALPRMPATATAGPEAA